MIKKPVLKESNPTPKVTNRYLLIGIPVTILLIAAASASAWLMQQQKIDALASERTNLVSQNAGKEEDLTRIQDTAKNLRAEIDTLKKTISDIQAPEQAELSISVSEAKHNGYVADQTIGKDLLYVTVTVKNDNPSLDGFFTAYDLRLKKDTNVYDLCQVSPVSYQCNPGLNVPGDKSELRSQTIKAGEVVTGVVAFYMPKDLASAILSYGNNSLLVKMQDADGKNLQ
jgi:hypothetical protein